MQAQLRDAVEDDLPAIVEIYNHAVQHTTAIWNDSPVDLANRRDWWTARRERGFPVLIAEREGAVAGYAAYGDWRAFDGFRHTVEHSVYVAPSHQGAGLGLALMRALIGRAEEAGLHAMIACIEAGNRASIGLHEKLGFRTVGIFPEVGRKFDRWLDLACLQLTLPRADPLKAEA